MTSHAEIVRRLNDALRRVRELEAELLALLDVVDPEPAAAGERDREETT